MLLELDQIIQNEFDIEGPRWGQKYYVSYPVNDYNWLRVHTKPRALILDFLVKADVFKPKTWQSGSTLKNTMSMTAYRKNSPCQVRSS
jgi:hypothetical protein